MEKRKEMIKKYSKDGYVLISKKEFYNIINDLDVIVSSSRLGDYVEFKKRDSMDLVGYSVHFNSKLTYFDEIYFIKEVLYEKI